MKRLTKSLGQYRFADRSGADNFAAYMVARMTELLELTPQSRVLELAPVQDIKRQSWRILSSMFVGRTD